MTAPTLPGSPGAAPESFRALRGADARPVPVPAAASNRGLLDALFAAHRRGIVESLRSSVELSGDLFEGNQEVKDTEVLDFRARRPAFVERAGAALDELYARRMTGNRRSRRRVDSDASVSTLRVLTAYDQEMQAALVNAAAFVLRFTRREMDALDLRVAEVMEAGHRHRDLDNPFDPSHVLDAIGLAARDTWPNPRVWRPLMERVLRDLTPALNKLYIQHNRQLADQGVLPEIKAALRARSEYRPDDDKDLIPTFTRMLHDAAQAVPSDIEIPDLPAGERALFDFDRAKDASAVTTMVPSAAPAQDRDIAEVARLITTRLAALSAVPAPARPAAVADELFPDLDPLMAMGSSSPLFGTLGQWQRADLSGLLGPVVQRTDAQGAVVPLNLVPYLQAAIASQIANPVDRITMDVIALLFDYVFRDPSIPAGLRAVFGRLQVPVLKAALVDRAFFSDRTHPARILLDHLADAAVGAQAGSEYASAFEANAGAVVDYVCSEYEIDPAVFAEADRRLVAFIDAERARVDAALEPSVARALDEETRDADRTEALALVRDRLTGSEVPFEVRSFAETTWVDYLVKLRREHGDGVEMQRATRLLDELLWSILAKERSAQKARLTKLIPILVAGLRKGCEAVDAAPARTQAFFEALYPLHVAAIRPVETDAAESRPVDEEARGTERGRPRVTPANAHDFVSDMVVGTWLVLERDGEEPVNARLSWTSPRRTKYILTSRTRRHAFVYTPEELAWDLANGRARLLLEPVPLFDRAVSCALDTLAQHQPPPGGTSPQNAPRAA